MSAWSRESAVRLWRAASLVVGVGFSVFCPAATITVDVGGGGDFTDIQAAVEAAADQDTVLVKPGEYVVAESISFQGKTLTLKGESGPVETTIRMTGRDSVVVFDNGEGEAAVLEGFTLTGGRGRRARLGGGVYCEESSPTLRNCTITGNTAGWGGGVLCNKNSSPTIVNCTITGNFAGESGAGVYAVSNSSPSLNNCIVWGNLGGSIGDDVLLDRRGLARGGEPR